MNGNSTNGGDQLPRIFPMLTRAHLKTCKVAWDTKDADEKEKSILFMLRDFVIMINGRKLY